jgi:four helix bundle protein
MVQWLNGLHAFPGVSMEKKYVKLNDVRAYTIAFHLSNEVWHILAHWDHFAKDTIGKQFMRAVDSISANIAEGFGRFTRREKIQFYRYAFGSLKESFDWNEKAKHRQLLSPTEYKQIFEQLNFLPKEINTLIKITKSKLTI